MSEPAYELGADHEFDPGHELDAEDALHGVVNQLIINGQRMSVIIPGSVIEIMPMLAELLRKGHAAGYLPSLLSAAMPWASVLPETDRERFASDLADAAAAGTRAPERLAACLREWQATAEVYADPSEAELLRQSLREADEGKVTPWEYDDASA
jgi:hypothetical protein